MMKKQSKANNPVEQEVTGPRSLTRLLRLFDILSQKTGGMSLAELNIKLSTPKSSLLNLLKPLVAEGFLRHIEGSYLLGPSIYRLSARVLSAWSFSKLIRPFMLELSHRTEETVMLGVLDPETEYITYVEIINSPHPVRYQIPVGTTRPLYITTGGRLLLAYADKKWQDKYIASLTFKFRTIKRITGQFLKRELIQIRAEGVSCSMDMVLGGLSGVSAPVFDPNGHCVATLTIAGPTERFQRDLESLKAVVKEVAEKASGITAETAAK
ncbi:MAG: IclR family transcriptional regulator [Sterolibacterium sp.]